MTDETAGATPAPKDAPRRWLVAVAAGVLLLIACVAGWLYQATPAAPPPPKETPVVVAPVAPPAAEPAPVPTPKPKPVAKPKPKPIVKPKPKTKRINSCAQVRIYVQQYGEWVVMQEARRRGNTEAQIEGFRKKCGL
jgi:outer membrane biosynthesis protein TonB